LRAGLSWLCIPASTPALPRGTSNSFSLPFSESWLCDSTQLANFAGLQLDWRSFPTGSLLMFPAFSSFFLSRAAVRIETGLTQACGFAQRTSQLAARSRASGGNVKRRLWTCV